MRTFAPKQEAAERAGSLVTPGASRAHARQKSLTGAGALQSVANQSEAHASKGPGGSTHAGRSPHVASDLSRVPVHAGTGARTFVQPKLQVNAPGDAYEQQADRIADRVMRMPEPALQRACECGGTCPKCRSGLNEQVQRKGAGSGGGSSVEAPPIVNEVLRSSGQPLDAGARSFMEPRIGHDFSRVRVHADNRAAKSAESIGAQAYTVGSNIVFGSGRYAPASREGRHLLAHELTHVVQQGGGAASSTSQTSTATVQRQAVKPKTPAPAAAAAPAAVSAVALPSAEELTTRIARCIGIWETNRGQDDPAPKESALDTVAGVHASMATIEQATMPYAITAIKGSKTLRDKATPPLTMKELNDADARCTAVTTLLASVADASANSEKPDDFIKRSATAITATGLSDADVKTMFSAVTLKGTVDKARTDIASEMDTVATENKTAAKKDQKDLKKEKAKKVQAAIDAIPAADRLGLGAGSLKAYINKASNWGENRAAWMRKAVGTMPDSVGTRIESVAVSESGTGLATPVIRKRVDIELAKKPVPSEEDIVKTVAQQNNPGEVGYGKNVWDNYHRLYP